MRTISLRAVAAPSSLLTLLVALIALVLTAVAPVADAVDTDIPAGRLVSDVAAPNTPHVLDGRVYSVAQVGNTIVLGGTFTRVRNDGQTNELTRNGLVAFDATTGLISTTFNPNPNGLVRAVLPTGDGTSVYVGGSFTTIAGASRQRVARVRVADGGLVTAFNAGAVTGEVKDLSLSQGRLWMGGAFTHVGGVAHPALATVNPTSGAVLSYMSLTIAGYHNEGVTQVLKMDLSPDGSRLVAIGNFDTLDGVTNHQLLVLDISGAAAAPSSFHTSFYTSPCASVFDSYMRDVDISPDGSWFAVGTTGAYGGPDAACDSVARFELGAAGADVRPSWVDYSGGDTTYSVEATAGVLYVGGHQRWWNNPFAGDRAGQGAVSREGIAALDPVNGLPLSWNPGRTKGVGVFDFLNTSQGLWVASDTDRIGNYQLKSRIARFNPQGVSFPAVRTPRLPADVYVGGAVGAATNPGVLYRVNAGGPALGADTGTDWASDTDADPSALHGAGSNRAGYAPVPSVDSTVPAGTPSAIFDTELWDPSGDPEQQWSFPVTAGTKVEVHLYFANRCDCTSGVGQRRFDVDIDGSRVLSQLDLVAEAGHGVGTMRSFPVTSDGSVDVTLDHEVENPLLNGIEIVRTDAAPAAAADSLRRRSFDGASPGQTRSAPSGGIDWSGVRGAFMINGTLYTALSDGTLTKRSFDGSTYGTVSAVDTADQIVPLTDWQSDIRNATGMFFDGGRIYYTLSGSATLYYRYFSPQSDVVGAKRLVASGSVSGVDFGSVRGMFVSPSRLYWGQSDGSLHSIAWSQTGASGVPVAGTATTVSGPSLDGADWAAHALFIFQDSTGGGGAGAGSVTSSFTQSCSSTACSFDASASQASGTTITSYAWSFGDGTSGTGVSPSHPYPGPGDYNVSLTVTGASGVTSTTAHTVTVAPVSAALTHVASDSAGANSSTQRVGVPSGVQPGDRLLLHLVLNDDASVPSTPAGWTAVDSFTGSGVVGRSWTKVATAADVGSMVTVSTSSTAKGVLAVSAYRSSTGTTTVSAHAASLDSASGTAHTSPSLALPVSAVVVTAWVTKSSVDTALGAPGSVVVRTTSDGAGGGRLTALVADSGDLRPAGTAAGQTATSSVAVTRTLMFSTAISPG